GRVAIVTITSACITAAADDRGGSGNMPQHDMSQMAGMDHSTMNHADMNSSGMLLMNESSGTGFQPASWPMPMIMTRAGGWNLLRMGQACLVEDTEYGSRGVGKRHPS